LSGRTVANLVKQYAAAAGFDVTEFSGHSLRAGFVTTAAASAATIWKMQAVTRHKTLDVLSGYVRKAEVFKDHAGAIRCPRCGAWALCSPSKGIWRMACKNG